MFWRTRLTGVIFLSSSSSAVSMSSTTVETIILLAFTALVPEEATAPYFLSAFRLPGRCS
jgi:hypothetical protein